MAENTSPAMCTDSEWEAARDAGLLFADLGSTAQEIALHKFAAAIRAQVVPLETSFEEKTRRNARVQARYDELRAEGKHGHYECMFRLVREEVERAFSQATGRQ